MAHYDGHLAALCLYPGGAPPVSGWSESWAQNTGPAPPSAVTTPPHTHSCVTPVTPPLPSLALRYADTILVDGRSFRRKSARAALPPRHRTLAPRRATIRHAPEAGDGGPGSDSTMRPPPGGDTFRTRASGYPKRDAKPKERVPFENR
ncbi:hypothetical protein MTP99_017748 [Tenebrio molitor]|nr:hypothetical protein MTP99_017748 [Tenebrio molitor]